MVEKDHQELIRLITKLDSRMDRIENALMGDSALGQAGIAKRLTDLEMEVEKIERKFSKIVWTVIGASGGATGLVQLLMNGMQ